MEQNKANKRIHRAWSMYDWANSAYNLVITSTIFPIYYLAITGDQQDDTIDYVYFFNWKVINTALLNYALSFAYLVVAFLSLFLSSVADVQGTKKNFMKLFCYVGAFACCGLYFFKPGAIELGILLAILAAIGYSGSIVFYNAYLPEIAQEKYHDKLSAQGFAYGYVGSVLLQLICFAFILMNFPDKTFAPRLAFLLVGIWWLGFAQIPFRILPDSAKAAGKLKQGIWKKGFYELRSVWIQVNQMPILKRYLAAFFFYSMGVQTVMLAAAEFAGKEIKKNVDGAMVPLGDTEMIIIILIIQLVAIAGAMLMARLSIWIGNLRVLMLTVVIWIGICVTAYFTRTDTQFYFLAALVGLVMGGIQAMSRSTFSKMMPATEDTASYFSFFTMAERLAIVFGLFTFGFIEHMTGNMRNSIFALAGFFIIGLILLIYTEWTRNKIGVDNHFFKPKVHDFLPNKK
jgi:UMF1 family MFS transporter